MQQYRRRGLVKHFEGAHRAARRAQQKQMHDLGYFYHQYRIELEEDGFREQLHERRTSTNLQEVSDNLDIFYIVNKLQQSCAIYSYQNVYKQEYDIHMVDAVLAHLKHKKYDEPLINLYYYGLLSLRDHENEEHFFQLKALLGQHPSLPKRDIQGLHAIARNFSIKRVNMGDQRFFKELFDLYQIGLESDILLNDKGMLSPSVFKNIIAVGLKSQEYRWVERFIEKHIRFLEEQQRESYYNYGLGKLYFSKNNYNRVIRYLSQVEYNDVFMMMDTKTLLLKTYYELDEFDALDALLESFKQLINWKKILAYHRTNYQNIIRLTRKLLHVPAYDQKKREAMHKEISDCEILTERKWLLDKLEELR